MFPDETPQARLSNIFGIALSLAGYIINVMGLAYFMAGYLIVIAIAVPVVSLCLGMYSFAVAKDNTAPIACVSVSTIALIGSVIWAIARR